MAAKNKPNDIYISEGDKFVINRAFAVPIARMFEAWADPKHFAQWMPPAGFDMSYLRVDIRSGGSSFYCMQGPGGMKMYGKAQYLEITRPDRIVYTQVFCDEHEKVIRHPMSPLWPETMLTTVVLSEEGPSATRITLTWEPVGQLTAAERDVFRQAKGGMTQGWTGSFDKLEAYLKR